MAKQYFQSSLKMDSDGVEVTDARTGLQDAIRLHHIHFGQFMGKIGII